MTRAAATQIPNCRILAQLTSQPISPIHRLRTKTNGRPPCQNASRTSPISQPLSWPSPLKSIHRIDLRALRSSEVTSKRSKSFNSETNVKRGYRSLKGGEKELVEKLGRNDPRPCGSARSFQAVVPEIRQV
jgi:hypothetical protein